MSETTTKPNDERPVPPELRKMATAVSESYGCKVDDLRGTGQGRGISGARQTLVWLARNGLFMGFPDIGSYLNRDASSMRYLERQAGPRINEPAFARLRQEFIGDESEATETETTVRGGATGSSSGS